jgi:hypothetical protein
LESYNLTDKESPVLSDWFTRASNNELDPELIEIINEYIGG